MFSKKAQFIPYKDDNVRMSFPLVTLILIIANVVIFFLSLSDFENIILGYGFTPASFSIITLFTSMFLHSSIPHLFGNMLYLWIFGDNVEDKLGRLKYIVFYILAGLAATLIHFLSNPASAIPAVGASGAISGVLGAYFVLFPGEKVRAYIFYIGSVKLYAFVIIGAWFLLQLTMAYLSPEAGIAFFAHIGGFVFGFLAGFVIKIFRLAK